MNDSYYYCLLLLFVYTKYLETEKKKIPENVLDGTLPILKLVFVYAVLEVSFLEETGMSPLVPSRCK